MSLTDKSELYYPVFDEKKVDPSISLAIRSLYDAIYYLAGKRGGPINVLDSMALQGHLEVYSHGAAFQIQEVPTGFELTTSHYGMGTATLVAGEVIVKSSTVRANTRIFLSPQDAGTGTAGALSISARRTGESFTITSTQASDDRIIAWLLIEPQGQNMTPPT